MNENEIKNIKRINKYLSECMVLLKSNGDFPINDLKDIALYGNGVRKTVKGGTGSGEVNSRFFINVYDGFKDAGINILTDDWLDQYDKVYLNNKKIFKKELRAIAKEKNQPIFIAAMGEIMPERDYDIKIDIKCDTAIYVLSRISGEAADRRLIKGDVYLTDTEIKDINYLNDNYKKFMLVLNTGGVIDLSPVINVKNILYLSNLGVETGSALVDVILGNKYPSGRLAETWSNPDDYQKIGDFGNPDDTRYKEGIYVGYRYFTSINKKPLFPFGYGLSYTKFNYEINNYELIDTKLLINVNVSNIGNYKGKEVIEAYVSKPSNYLNQAYLELISFEKTKELNIGENENIKIEIDLYNLTSYDQNIEAYILLKGDYIIRIGNDCFNNKPILKLVFNENIIIKKVKNLFNKIDFEDYIIDNPKEDLDLPKIIIDSNIFNKKIINYKENYEILNEIKELSDDDLIKFNMGAFDPRGGLKSIVGNQGKKVAGSAGESARIGNIDSITMADGPQGLRLAKDYYLTKNGSESATGLIPESVKEYIPFWLRIILWILSPKHNKKNALHQYTTAIPIASALANSFNKKLAYDFGYVIGSEMEDFNVDLWLAPALNIHRNILCGRNFEYYSEDPYLSGIMASYVTKGVQAHKGCGVTIKHFLCNNQEYNRYVNNSIVSERTIREIYLRGFEICINEAKPRALMTSYNLLNGIHTSENYNINELLLRHELEFDGIIMSDWVVDFMQNEYKYQNAKVENVIKAHTNLFMPGSKKDFEKAKKAFMNKEFTRLDLEINASRLYKNIIELKSEKEK